MSLNKIAKELARNSKVWIFSALAIVLVISFQNCAKRNFKTEEPSKSTPVIPGEPGPASIEGSDGGPACVDEVISITVPTKMLFLVDTSGSNAYTSTVNFPEGTVSFPATDKTKSFRIGVMQKFLNEYKAKANFSWGFVTFSQPQNTSGEMRALINSGSESNPTFSKDPADFQKALDTFKTIEDKPYAATPYFAAQNMAIKAIQNDPDLTADPKTQYIVVLLTDGLPTDGYNSADPAALMAVAPKRVKLSVAYYTSVQNAKVNAFLSAVTASGAGVFKAVTSTNWSVTQDFKIDDVIPGTKQNCQ